MGCVLQVYSICILFEITFENILQMEATGARWLQEAVENVAQLLALLPRGRDVRETVGEEVKQFKQACPLSILPLALLTRERDVR